MLTKFLNIGYSKSLNFEEEMKVRMLNAFALIFFLFLLFFVFFNLFYSKLYLLALIELIILLGTPLIVWLQYKGKHHIARVIFFVFLHGIIFYTSVFLNPGRRIEYFYLVIIIFVMILVEKSAWRNFIILIDIVLFFAPQVLFKVYFNESFPYANSLALTITMVFSLRFFIHIQKQYRAKINYQKDRLEAINIEKNDLMSIVAHDLKSPLAQIKGLVSILELEGSQLNKEQIELINKIKGVTESQHEKITTFLDAKALEDRAEEISFENFDVIQSIQSVFKDMSTLAQSKSIQLVDTYDAKAIITYGSEDSLNKITSNLVSNAIKYSYPNSTINIKVTSDENQILLLVKDQGQGFKKEDLRKVFLKNQVLSATPTADESATGVGLYIVKKYVDMMEGWVWLESVEGKGSTFFVKLPRLRK